MYIPFVLITVRQNKVKYTKNPWRGLFCRKEIFRKVYNNENRNKVWTKLFLLQVDKLAACTGALEGAQPFPPLPLVFSQSDALTLGAV